MKKQKGFLDKIRGRIPVGARSLYNRLQDRGYGIEFDTIVNGDRQGIDVNVIASESATAFDTNIEIKKALALASRRKDYYIHQLLLKKKWDFKHMRYILNPYHNAPLTALLLFYTEQKCKVRYTVKGHTREGDITEETDFVKLHRVPVYGLYGGETNRIWVELIDRRGVILDSREIRLKTEPLPEVLHHLVYEVSKTTEPAVPLLFLTGGGEVLPCAFDWNGDIRYYLNCKTTVYGIFPLKNGHFLQSELGINVPTFAHQHAIMIHEMDYMGRIHNSFIVEKGLHHFATELPNGNILGVSNTIENHTEDCIVEIDRKTGAIIKTIKLIDVLGDTFADMTDWVHPNAIQYFPESKELMLCLRNVHTVLRIDYDTLEIKWLLSTPEMWRGTALADKVLKPVGDVRWHYQAHAAVQLSNVTGKPDELLYIMLFDNHRINRRPMKEYDGAEDSFVLIYGVDVEKGTVCQIHEYVTPESLIRSNAVYDASHDRIYAMAGVVRSDAGGDARVAEIIEYDYATEQPLNKLKLQKDFFSAYPFSWDMKSLAAPIDLKGRYMRGQAATVMECERGMERELEELQPDRLILNSFIIDNLLMLKIQDHSVDSIYFVSEEHTYKKDYTDTYQTMKRFANGLYYIMLSFENLEKGRYAIVTEREGEYYRLDQYIEIR